MTGDRLGLQRTRGTVSRGQSSACAAKGDLNNLVFHVAKHGNLHAKDEDGLALVHHAACQGNLSLIRKLYELGADMNLSDNGTPPWKPIHYAIFHRQHEAEQVLRTFGVQAPLPIVNRVAERMHSERAGHVLTIKL